MIKISSDTTTTSVQRPRPRGLSEATNVHSKSSIDKTKHGGIYLHSSLAPASAPYQSNSQINGLHKPEPSKALLSGDWRQRPSVDGKVESLHINNFTNCVPKLESKEGEKRKQKKLRVDTIAARSAGSSRRFRNQENSPLEPNFILSAPATSDEFSYVTNDSAENENHEEKPDCPKSLSNNLFLGPKHLVEMNSLHSPASDGGYIYVSSGLIGISPVNSTNSVTSCSSSSFGLATMSGKFSGTSTVHLTDSTSIEIMKQVAQLQRVRNLNGLKIRPWDQVKSEILTPSPALGQHFLGRSSLLSTGDENAHEQEGHGFVESTKTKRDDNVGYQRILAKLRNNSVQDKQTPDLARTSINRSHALKADRSSGMEPSNSSKELLTQAPNTKVKYNNFSEKARTLNPKAPEFKAPEKRKSATYHLGSPIKFVRPSIIDLFDQRLPTTQFTVANTVTQHLANASPLNQSHTSPLLNPRRMLIAAQLIQYLAQNSGTWPNGAELGLIMELAGMTESHMADTSEMSIRDRVPLNSMGSLTATYPPTQHSCIPSIYNGVATPSRIFAANNDPTVGPANMMHPSSLKHERSGAFSMVPSPSIIDTVTNKTRTFPSTVSRAQQGLQAVGKDFRGIRTSSSKMNLFGARNIATKRSSQFDIPPSVFFGPKPVSKPKGPPRPNDPHWSKQQQEYEAYLEWRRAYDPEYHQDCRDRQAKRADKNKLKEVREHFKIPSKKSAAIKIKKPVETDGKDEDIYVLNNT